MSQNKERKITQKHALETFAVVKLAIIFTLYLFVGNLSLVSADDSSSATVFFIVDDGKAPNITINSPEAITYRYNDIPLRITSDEGLAAAWFILDGGARVDMTKETDVVFSYMMNNLRDKNYTLTVYAQDAVGNISSKTINFVVDCDDGSGKSRIDLLKRDQEKLNNYYKSMVDGQKNEVVGIETIYLRAHDGDSAESEKYYFIKFLGENVIISGLIAMIFLASLLILLVWGLKR